ncbi:hypothetical protein AB1Y20_016318 [Prymnesium parvum]|uniref:Uncharacterized protein n=1 Tax=Prymnesium parvum TaxID=97485 RepID=A0AB34IEZ7_PRYPA|mmetsp:Transcript_7696/g.11675  ORF Transcript_7696/g.11675 Transcript_7696/m.11675 type:complete len:144 (-) Transcript_7696:355-786(-)
MSYNPHVRVPLKSSGMSSWGWKPTIGERTSDEYGAFSPQAKREDKRVGSLAKEKRIKVGLPPKHEVQNSGLGRRARNLEPSAPPPEEVLYTRSIMTGMPETERNEWFKNKGWVSRLGEERPPVGHSGLGRRLRGCEPSMDSLD